ncbi:MAG: alpha-glucuronidase, partial [Lachnospiraceae bacterium]|nr:alpha-glucuronidase [Lachnospiraceae bacterium]
MSYENAWLNYQRNPENADKSYFSFVSVNGEGRVIKTAVTELKRAAKEILAVEMTEVQELAAEGIFLKLNPGAEAGEEGYHISEKDGTLTVESAGEKGILYGCFAVIRMLQTGKQISGTEVTEVPDNPIRILNHWDNIDGSIERGYSGESFFFQDQKVLVNDRTRAYARLAASVGINASVINN